MKLLSTACLVAVALGTPDHMPHTIQTDKKPLTKKDKATMQEEIKKIAPVIVHSQMSKEQEAQLAKDISEVEKMRKALAQAEHQAAELKTDSATTTAPAVKQTAKIEEKTQTAAPQVTASKTAAPEAAAETPKSPKVAEAKVAEAKVAEAKVAEAKVAEAKVAEAKVAEPKSEHKAAAIKTVKPEAKPALHEKTTAAAAPVHHEEAKSGAVAAMKERLAKAEAKGEQQAIAKMSSTSHKHTTTKTNLRRIPVMRPRNFAKTVAQWEAANPVGSKGMLHAGRVHLSHPHIAALPVVKALPWTSTPSPVTTNATKADAVAVNLGAEKKVGGKGASPEVIAKFTESAQASAERAHKHLEEAKKAFAKTSANADQIHETGKKIEQTAGTIKYLYSTPEPPPPPTTQAPPPAPKEKSAANSPRSFLIVGFLTLGAAVWAC